jgi:hypothetical protein
MFHSLFANAERGGALSKHALHPVDVPVALHLLDRPADPYAGLASDLEISSSTAHQSVRRLFAAGLLRHGFHGERAVNRQALLEFLTHGVRYAFPTAPAASTRGVATAHAGPALREAIVADDAIVWPAEDGECEGAAIEPFWPRAASVARKLPTLYALLSAVDALRVGRARERQLATAYLTRVILRRDAATEEPAPRLVASIG